MSDIRTVLKQAASQGEAAAPTVKTPAGINVAAEAEKVARMKREQAAKARPAPIKGYRQIMPPKR